MFVDRIDLHVKGGDGGRGMVAFRREKYVPRGGPEGGDGGNGGSIILRAEPNADNLAPLVTKRMWKAKHGEPGGGSNCHGKTSPDVVIPVPPGTMVRDRERGNLLKDLVNPGDEVVIAKGGRGGRGNRAFASSTNRTPRQFEPGEQGEERWITLELKVLADVGLVGFPNAGKSTLLSRVSRATPEIAAYPFTTKHPNLGIVGVGDATQFVLADLPGLIEGAHAGVGLGHEFLRHVERTRVLVHLVEPLPSDGGDPVANYHAIRKELTLYSLPLSAKPEIVCVSKAELTGSEEVALQLAADLGRPVKLFSSVTGQGLSDLVAEIIRVLADVKRAEALLVKPVTQFSTESAVRTEEQP